MLMVLLVTQVVMGTSSAFADTVTGSVTFDSSVWGTTNRQFDNGSTQTWTNYLTLTLNPVTAGDNCRISGGYLGLYHQSTLEITAPVGCTITGMTIAGSNYGGTPSTTPGSLTSEPGSTSYTWTGSSSSVTISTDAGEHDSYDFQSIVVTYETSLDAMATTTSNGAIYSFNQNPNPFFGVSLYAKTITAGNQEMYFDAFGSDDPMIMQNLVDSSFYLHMPAQSRLRLQRSDSSSDIYITKAVFTFVSGSPSISPDGGTYNSSTHTWTGQESQIIFLFNEEADIQLIESEAGLLYSLAITSEGGGSVSYTASSGSGTVGANNSNSFMVNDGEEVMLTFTPSSDAYKVVAATVNGTNVFDALTIDGTYTIPSVTGNLTVYGGFDINESVNQHISLQEVPFWLHEDGLWGLNAPKNTQITPDWVVGESTGQPYGYSGVSHWADLSGYDKLVVTVTEGTPRILMNRDMDEGYWNENEEESHMIEYPQSDGAWSNKYFSKETTTNGDVYTVDLKQMKTDKGFVHLHAIKGANWQNVTVTSMMLELDGDPEFVITSSGAGTVDWSIPTGVGVVNANSQSDTISVQYDGELTLTFTPNTGYHLAHAYVNNVDYVSQMSGNVLTLHVTQRDYRRIFDSYGAVGFVDERHFANGDLDTTTHMLLVKADTDQSGTSVNDLYDGIQSALSKSADAAVSGPIAERVTWAQMIDSLMTPMVGLIAVAVLVALIGVANTLSLSVIERTRESATLRAIGMTRGQLRASLAIEALLISLVSGIAGILLGTLFGWLGAYVVFSLYGTVVFPFEWGVNGIVLAVAAVAALLASIAPARRAVKVPPVEALAEA